jgi:hypothetical protein
MGWCGSFFECLDAALKSDDELSRELEFASVLVRLVSSFEGCRGDRKGKNEKSERNKEQE